MGTQVSRIAKRLTFTTALTALISTVMITPSYAGPTLYQCVVNTDTFTCTSTTIRANSSGHYIDYSIGDSSWSTVWWKIVDSANGKIVKSGNEGSLSSASGRITGLYSTYKLEMDNRGDSAVAIGWITN